MPPQIVNIKQNQFTNITIRIIFDNLNLLFENMHKSGEKTKRNYSNKPHNLTLI